MTTVEKFYAVEEGSGTRLLPASDDYWRWTPLEGTAPSLGWVWERTQPRRERFAPARRVRRV